MKPTASIGIPAYNEQAEVAPLSFTLIHKPFSDFFPPAQSTKNHL